MSLEFVFNGLGIRCWLFRCPYRRGLTAQGVRLKDWIERRIGGELTGAQTEEQRALEFLVH